MNFERATEALAEKAKKVSCRNYHRVQYRCPAEISSVLALKLNTVRPPKADNLFIYIHTKSK